MVCQPASVLSRDVDVSLVTKSIAVYRSEEDKKQKLLRHDTTIEKPNFWRSKYKSFIVRHAFIVLQPVRVLFVFFF